VSGRNGTSSIDVKQLERDVRAGRVKPERLVELIAELQQKLAEGKERIRTLEATVQKQQQELVASSANQSELQRKLAEAQERIRTLEATVQKQQQELAAWSANQFEEPFSVQAEEKRQEVRGKKAKRKKTKPQRQGRFATAEKLAQAQQEEDVFPEGVDPHQCKLSHSRPVWRLIGGQAVLVAYHVYRGPRNQYGKIPGVLGRSGTNGPTSNSTTSRESACAPRPLATTYASLVLPRHCFNFPMC